MIDVECADRVVAVTDHLCPHRLCPIDISQETVVYVVERYRTSAGAQESSRHAAG